MRPRLSPHSFSLLQLWANRFEYSEQALPAAVDAAQTQPHDMFGCAEPALVAWCSRLNFWIELIEHVYPRQFPHEEDQAAATYEQLDEESKLEEVKTVLITRLCQENGRESMHGVLGWPVMNMDLTTFIETYETAPYYLKMGAAANHDMLMLRMTQARVAQRSEREGVKYSVKITAILFFEVEHRLYCLF